MTGFFHAGNGGFHKIYFSPSFRSFFTFLGTVVGVRWRHFVQLTQNRVFSPIATRFHLKAKKGGYQGVVATWRTETRVS